MKSNLVKRLLATVLIAALIIGTTGCGAFSPEYLAEVLEQLSGDSENDDEEITEDEDADSTDDTDKEDSEDSDDSEDEDEEDDGKKVLSFKVDESFKDATFGTTSPDLIEWLCATYAIQTDANDLDLTLIGGMEREDISIGSLVQGLKAGWNVTDRESTFAVVETLVGDDGTTDDDAWDFSRAEQVLGLAYCVGYIELDEYLEYAVPIGRMIQSRYDNWDEFGKNYLTYYMGWVANGGFGRAGDINQRFSSHEYFVAAAEYYDSPYTIDFDLDLTIDTVASYYDNMDPNKEAPGPDKIPEYVKYYTTPDELGVRPDSGLISIEGDIYMMPITVQALLDNGWTIADESADLELESVNGKEITFNKNNKSMTLKAESFTNCSTAIENGLIERINFAELEDIDLVLPGDIKMGKPEDKVYTALLDGGISEEELDKSNGAVEFSLAGIGEAYNGSSMEIFFDYKTHEVKDVWMYCLAPGATSNETSINTGYSQIDIHITTCRRKQIMTDSVTGGPKATRQAFSDDPEDFMFCIGNRVLSLGGTIDDLIAMGFIPDEKYYDADTVVKPGEYYNFYANYRGSSSYSMIFGFENHTSESVKITDADLNLFMVSLIGWTYPEKVPVHMAKDIYLLYSTKREIEDAFGPLKKIDGDGTEMDGIKYDYYQCSIENGTIRFAISQKDETVGNFLLIKGNN